MTVTASTAMLTLPGVAWFALRPTCSEDIADLNMHDVFGDSCQVRELGKEYRYVHPEEDDLDVLQDLISPRDERINLDELIDQDFANGNTVQVHGWILSRTEARHYALFSLLAD